MRWKSWIIKSWTLGLGLSLLAPVTAFAMGESTIQNYVGRQVLVPLIKPSWGNFILHSDLLNKIYSERGYSALWVDEQGVPNAQFKTLLSVFQKADRHGLMVRDYYDADLQMLHEKVQKNSGNWITFELATTEALIRYATHLSVGRFDPELVDTDIKFKRRTFTEYKDLAAIAGSSDLAGGLERFAPTHPRYRDLMDILSQMRQLKNQGGWTPISISSPFIKKGSQDPAVAQVRQRLNSFGYKVSLEAGATFDAELEAAVREYQANNGLTVDGAIGPKEFLRSLNYTVGQRISQIEVSMEKLRWLPKQIESRHIFVNLATSEFRLYDEGVMPFHFKTVSGQPFRRTPSMRDAITFVDLNPTWTVPHSIAVKDKIAKIKADPSYLDKHDMKLLDAATDRVVDPRSVNWDSINARNFPYYIRQNPGPENALGVVKFPLQNPWQIYMHDTNEKTLFMESDRHRSSGCVRLEQPLELAAYLLKDQPDWTLEKIKAFVPMTVGQKGVELSRKVNLKKAMPVYFIYLSVEKSETGAIRFVDDEYGQDLRLAKALFNRRVGGELF